MNILHIISGGEVGGSKAHLLTLAQTIKFNHIKNIIVCFIEGDLYQEAVGLGLDIRLIKQKNRFDVTIIAEIKKICVEEDIDIVNCHGGRANFVGLLLKPRYEAKYVSTIHSDYKDDYRGNLFKSLIFSNINRVCLKFYNNYITVSDSFKTMMIDRGYKSDKIHVVYNGINFYEEKPLMDKKDILINNGIIGARHYVTMVARFHPVKGHYVFLDACKKVLESFEDVIFVLVGDGAMKQDLLNYVNELGIKNSVYFAGFKKPDEYIYISDFTILASYTESFPLILLESAYYNKTVVATEVGGVGKLIEDGVSGYLVKPSDSEAMADKMLELLKDRKKSIEFGKKLGEFARANFSLQNMADSYVKIYREIDGGIFYEN